MWLQAAVKDLCLFLFALWKELCFIFSQTNEIIEIFADSLRQGLNLLYQTFRSCLQCLQFIMWCLRECDFFWILSTWLWIIVLAKDSHQDASINSERETIKGNFGYSRVGYTKLVHSYVKTSERYDLRELEAALTTADKALDEYWTRCANILQGDSNFTYFKEEYDVMEIPGKCFEKNMIVPQLVIPELEEELLRVMKKEKLDKILLAARFDMVKNQLVWDSSSAVIFDYMYVGRQNSNPTPHRDGEFWPDTLLHPHNRSNDLWLITDPSGDNFTIMLDHSLLRSGPNRKTPLLCMKPREQIFRKQTRSNFGSCGAKVNTFQNRVRLSRSKLLLINRSLKLDHSIRLTEGVSLPPSQENEDEASFSKKVFREQEAPDLTGVLVTSIPRMKNMFPSLLGNSTDSSLDIDSMRARAELLSFDYDNFDRFYAAAKKPKSEGSMLQILTQHEQFLTDTLVLIEAELQKIERIFYDVVQNDYVASPRIYRDVKQYIFKGESSSLSPKAWSAAILPGRFKNTFVVFGQFPVTSVDLPIYEIIPLPIPAELSEMVIPLVKTQYMAVTGNKQYFYALTTEQLAKCKNKVCELESPRREISDEACGPAQFSTQIAPNCQYRLFPLPYFIKTTPTVLYFSMRDKVHYQLECTRSFPHNPHFRGRIRGVGLMSIATSCFLQFPALKRRYVFPDSILEGNSPIKTITVEPFIIPADQVIYENVEDFENSFKHYVDDVSHIFVTLTIVYFSVLVVILIALSLTIYAIERRWKCTLRQNTRDILAEVADKQRELANRARLRPFLFKSTPDLGSEGSIPSVGKLKFVNPFVFPSGSKQNLGDTAGNKSSSETALKAVRRMNVYTKIPGEPETSASDSSLTKETGECEYLVSFKREEGPPDNPDPETVKILPHSLPGVRPTIGSLRDLRNGKPYVPMARKPSNLASSDSNVSGQVVQESILEEDEPDPIKALPVWEEPGHSQR